MKKKLLLMSLMIAVLVCVFAISVFAEDIIVSKTENEEYGTVIQLNADPGLDNAKQYVSTLNKIEDAGTDKDALCILTDGDAENPSYYVFPSSYVVLERTDGRFDIYATALAQAMAEFNTAMGTKYYAGYTLIGGGGGKRINEVVRFEFTSDVTFVHADYCCMRECPKLLEVRFKYAIDLTRASNMFQKNSKLTTVVGLEKATGGVLAKAMFMSCGSLRSVSFPTDIERIPSSMFWGCKYVTIDNLAECTKLTTIGDSAFQDTGYLVFTLPDTVTTIEASAFQSAFKDGNGGSFTINPTSQLVTIGNNAFRDCRMLKSIYIPSTVTSIGSSAFRQTHSLVTLENFENCKITELCADTFYDATSIKCLKLPRTLTTISTAFYKNNNLSLVYIPDTVTSIADTFTGTQPDNAVYVYTGKDSSVMSACTRLAGANVISASDYDTSATYTGINLVYGYSRCIVYNGGVHSETVVDTVVSTFLEDIQVVSRCVVCDITENTGKIAALFVCRGYSVSEKGGAGIVISFKVNREAVSEYEKIENKTVEYGLFAVAKDRLGENDIFDANGNAATGVINAEMSRNNFAIFDLKITGISDEQKDYKLAFGAYVAVSDEEATEYSYLQIDTANNGEKYNFTSYNEILNSLA